MSSAEPRGGDLSEVLVSPGARRWPGLGVAGWGGVLRCRVWADESGDR